MRRLLNQLFIGRICRQIRIGVGVLGIFIGSGIFQIGVRRSVIGILGILLCCRNVSIVIGVRVSISFTVICIGERLACLLGKRVILRLITQVEAIIHRSVDSLYRRLLLFVFSFPLGLRLVLISRFHVRLVVVPVLFQPCDVRALVGIFPIGVLFPVDQPGIDPAMYHVVHAVHGAGFVIHRKRVDEAAVHNGQLHIPFPGFDFTHAHIATVGSLCQIDAAFCAGVDLGAAAVHGMDIVRGGNSNGLIYRADAAVVAGQIDTETFHGSTTARLGNIPVRGQGHFPEIRVLVESGIAVLALERNDFHIAIQASAAASGGNVDIPLAGRNSAEPDVVRYRTASLRADRSNVDILDIVFRRQVHDLAFQSRVIKLEDSSPYGVNRQCSFVMRVRHIACQVDATACCVGAGKVDTSFFRADQPDGDRLGGVNGIVIELDGVGACFPPIMDMLEPTQKAGTGDPMLMAISP